MTVWFTILTVFFIIVSAAMVLIILVQRPQGGGLAGAFGGAGGTGSDTVFGGRVGDALTVMTVIAFIAYLGLAIGLNLIDADPTAPVEVTPAVSTPVDDLTPPGGAAGERSLPFEEVPPPVTAPPAEDGSE